MVAAVVVLLLLFALQMLRVNAPRAGRSDTQQPTTYTPKGVLISGDINVPAEDFFQQRINLNRSAKIFGSFRTPNIKSRVSIVVIREENLDRWMQSLDYKAITQTGYVPGGKINGSLDPGVYLLLIDNRWNDFAQSVFVDFSLD